MSGNGDENYVAVLLNNETFFIKCVVSMTRFGVRINYCSMKVYFVIVACALSSCFAAWQENVRPKMYVQLGKYRCPYLFTYICLKYLIVMLHPASNRRNAIYLFKKIYYSQIEQQKQTLLILNIHSSRMKL